MDVDMLASGYLSQTCTVVWDIMFYQEVTRQVRWDHHQRQRKLVTCHTPHFSHLPRTDGLEGLQAGKDHGNGWKWMDGWVPCMNILNILNIGERRVLGYVW